MTHSLLRRYDLDKAMAEGVSEAEFEQLREVQDNIAKTTMLLQRAEKQLVDKRKSGATTATLNKLMKEIETYNNARFEWLKQHRDLEIQFFKRSSDTKEEFVKLEQELGAAQKEYNNLQVIWDNEVAYGIGAGASGYNVYDRMQQVALKVQTLRNGLIELQADPATAARLKSVNIQVPSAIANDGLKEIMERDQSRRDLLRRVQIAHQAAILNDDQRYEDQPFVAKMREQNAQRGQEQLSKNQMTAIGEEKNPLEQARLNAIMKFGNLVKYNQPKTYDTLSDLNAIKRGRIFLSEDEQAAIMNAANNNYIYEHRINGQDYTFYRGQLVSIGTVIVDPVFADPNVEQAVREYKHKLANNALTQMNHNGVLLKHGELPPDLRELDRLVVEKREMVAGINSQRERAAQLRQEADRMDAGVGIIDLLNYQQLEEQVFEKFKTFRTDELMGLSEGVLLRYAGGNEPIPVHLREGTMQQLLTHFQQSLPVAVQVAQRESDWQRAVVHYSKSWWVPENPYRDNMEILAFLRGIDRGRCWMHLYHEPVIASRYYHDALLHMGEDQANELLHKIGEEILMRRSYWPIDDMKNSIVAESESALYETVLHLQEEYRQAPSDWSPKEIWTNYQAKLAAKNDMIDQLIQGGGVSGAEAWQIATDKLQENPQMIPAYRDAVVSLEKAAAEREVVRRDLEYAEIKMTMLQQQNEKYQRILERENQIQRLEPQHQANLADNTLSNFTQEVLDKNNLLTRETYDEQIKLQAERNNVEIEKMQAMVDAYSHDVQVTKAWAEKEVLGHRNKYVDLEKEIASMKSVNFNQALELNKLKEEYSSQKQINTHIEVIKEVNGNNVVSGDHIAMVNQMYQPNSVVNRQDLDDLAFGGFLKPLIKEAVTEAIKTGRPVDDLDFEKKYKDLLASNQELREKRIKNHEQLHTNILANQDRQIKAFLGIEQGLNKLPTMLDNIRRAPFDVGQIQRNVEVKALEGVNRQLAQRQQLANHNIGNRLLGPQMGVAAGGHYKHPFNKLHEDSRFLLGRGGGPGELIDKLVFSGRHRL